MQVLKTKNAAYLFDPQNDDLVLKERGKFSSVYVGTRIDDKTRVVIKKLALIDDFETSIRFQKESLTGINSSYVPATLDAWKDETGYYLVKEFVDGFTLRYLLKQEIKNRQQFFTKVVINVCEALKEFHEQNIFHCDLRPDNIIVAGSHLPKIVFAEPQIKLLDFGLAKTPDTFIEGQRTPFALIYSPPEQLLNYGRLIGPQTDIYSLGITLYECITGDYAFKHINPEMLMQMQLNLPIKEDERLSKNIFSVLRKATAKATFRLPPAQLNEEEIIQTTKAGIDLRYASVDLFRDDLENCLKEPEKKKKSIFNW